MRDAVKIAREAGRFDRPMVYNEISLAIENERHTSGYVPPQESPYHIIMRTKDELDDIADRKASLGVLNQIKRAYRS